MSERKAFDVGYRLAVRHVIEQLEQFVAAGSRASELSAELRNFYKEDLQKEAMTVQSLANVQGTT